MCSRHLQRAVLGATHVAFGSKLVEKNKAIGSIKISKCVGPAKMKISKCVAEPELLIGLWSTNQWSPLPIPTAMASSGPLGPGAIFQSERQARTLPAAAAKHRPPAWELEELRQLDGRHRLIPCYPMLSHDLHHWINGKPTGNHRFSA